MNHNHFQYYSPRTRNRKPQWTHKETQHLIREFDKRKLVLRPKLGEVVSSAMKHRAWVEISQAVNLTNPHVHRTVSEVQKKWQNLCLRMKKSKDRNSDAGSDDNVGRKDVESMILEQSQSFISPEELDGDVMTIKIESVDSFDRNGTVNYVEDTDSRPESTRSKTNYSDSELASTVIQSDFNDYPNSSDLPPETGGHVLMEHHGTKRSYDREDVFSQAMDSELKALKKQTMIAELQMYRTHCEKLLMEKDKLQVEKEKLILEKDKLVLEVQNLRTVNQQIQLSQHKTHSQLEKERLALENEKLTIELRNMKTMAQTGTEKVQLEKSRLMLENDKLGLEIQNLRNTGGAKYNGTQSYVNLTM